MKQLLKNMCPVDKALLGFLGILVIWMIIVVILLVSINNTTQNESTIQEKILITNNHSNNDSIPCTAENVHAYMQYLNIKHLDVAFAIVQLESNFQPGLRNNLFGMKCAKARPHTYTDQDSSYAVYDCWEDSVLDYALFEAKYGSNLSESEWLDYLAKNYATDKNWGKKINKILAQIR